MRQNLKDITVRCTYKYCGAMHPTADLIASQRYRSARADGKRCAGLDL